MKVVKILQELAESEPKPITNIKGKDGKTYLKKKTELQTINRVSSPFPSLAQGLDIIYIWLLMNFLDIFFLLLLASPEAWGGFLRYISDKATRENSFLD